MRSSINFYFLIYEVELEINKFYSFVFICQDSNDAGIKAEFSNLLINSVAPRKLINCDLKSPDIQQEFIHAYKM